MVDDSRPEFVVDASFVLAFLIPSQKTKPVDDYFQRHELGEVNFVSVSLLPFEVFNGLKSAVLKRQLQRNVVPLAEAFWNSGIRLENVDFRIALEIAFKNNLSFYDAVYFALASSKNIPLLTLDKRLAALTIPK